MTKNIHQFVSGFANGDAISNEALAIRAILRSWGYASEIYCETNRILPDLRKTAFDMSVCERALKQEDVVILHLSIGSATNDVFARLKCRKAIIYHNITPHKAFLPINSQTASCLELGRKQLAQLAGSAEVNLADSRYNAGEMTELGYKEVKVLPLVIDFSLLDSRQDNAVIRKYNDGVKNIIFVGRMAPNKKIEDCIKAFSYIQKHVNSNTRFIHIGSYAGTERYYRFTQAFAKEIGTKNVEFAGSVPQAALNAYYKIADLFLCMSEHEGCCIPILEAMHHRVPVAAFAAAAVPETMDGAGILFLEKDYPVIAETAGRVISDSILKERLIAGQDKRMTRYKKIDLAEQLKEHLKPLLGN